MQTHAPALHARALVTAGCTHWCRSGADKVSIGSDAVDAAEQYYARGRVADGRRGRPDRTLAYCEYSAYCEYCSAESRLEGTLTPL